MSEISKSNMRLVRVSAFKEISELINKPFNRPAFSNAFRIEDFEIEYSSVYSVIRKRLEIFEEVSCFGKKGISLGPPASSRKIGIVLDLKEFFRFEFIYAIWEILVGFQQDYLVYIDGEYEAGEESFYICITKADRVLGYAENTKSLEPFGFK